VCGRHRAKFQIVFGTLQALSLTGDNLTLAGRTSLDDSARGNVVPLLLRSNSPAIWDPER
jgi:hypothetical protein